VLERLAVQGYQFCVIDPEGDYEGLPGAIVFGSAERAPRMPETVSALAKPDARIVVNLVSLPLREPGIVVNGSADGRARCRSLPTLQCAVV
jgi:hypothetical protein